MNCTLLSRFANFIIPPVCAGCDSLLRDSGLFCPECADAIAYLPRNQEQTTEQGILIISPFAYGGPVASAIHRLKFSKRPELARRLASPVAERLHMKTPPLASVLVPVPATPERIVERGYNQSALLAVALARKTNLKCLPLALERTHFAPHQVGASKAQRAAQVAGAFTATRRGLANTNVILVDDVVTTGATSAACAAALEAIGAKVIAVAAIARVL